MVLIFSADETKNRSPLEYLLPESLVPWLESYLTEVRPIFPDADTTRALWLGQDGPVTSPYFVYQRITKLTKRLFGTSLNPHLLRDCAATSLALVSPDAAPLLGHRHFSTTERYYVQAASLEASRRLNELLARAKASLGKGT